MRFAYTYRSSDGQRHTAEIEAESRDAAFAAIRRELGVKPIKVTAAGGRDRQDARDNQDARDAKRRRAIVLGVVGVLMVLALGAWLWARRADAPYQVMTPQGPVTLSVAAPLTRQRIPGDRSRIEAAVAKDRNPPVFRFSAEAWLARYAEPGRQVPANDKTRVADHDFQVALREPIRIASTDYTEWVDLKRIVAGMKREMGAYLAAGGTVDGYLEELEKRQKLEISYRERAEQRLQEMLADKEIVRESQLDASGENVKSVNHEPQALNRQRLAAAYAFWLKANAQLKSMGIWEIPLPETLRPYQMNLDIDE